MRRSSSDATGLALGVDTQIAEEAKRMAGRRYRSLGAKARLIVEVTNRRAGPRPGKLVKVAGQSRETSAILSQQ